MSIRVRDITLIKHYFREYYYKHYKLIATNIRDIESREFAYIDFNLVMHRHIGLKENEFKEWLIKVNPLHLYHSSAYYLFPDKPMSQKGWEGADLIFDIDLDHIRGYNPPCIKICSENNTSKKVVSSDDECRGRVEEKIMLDERGILLAKKELLKLLNKLNNDFGIKLDELEIYYSGARGFHVHVYKDEFKELDSIERMEIKDYLTLDGFDIGEIRDINNPLISNFITLLLNNSDVLREFISDGELEKLKSYVIGGNLNSMLRLLKRNKEVRNTINELIVRLFSVQIDGVVTIDTSRLIRAPFSLHGKTGLIKKKVKYEEIDEFNPFCDAVRDDEVYVYAKVIYVPNIYWAGMDINECYDCTLKIPFSLAIYLANLGLAYEFKRV